MVGYCRCPLVSKSVPLFYQQVHSFLFTRYAQQQTHARVDFGSPLNFFFFYNLYPIQSLKKNIIQQFLTDLTIFILTSLLTTAHVNEVHVSRSKRAAAMHSLSASFVSRVFNSNSLQALDTVQYQRGSTVQYLYFFPRQRNRIGVEKLFFYTLEILVLQPHKKLKLPTGLTNDNCYSYLVIIGRETNNLLDGKRWRHPLVKSVS